MGTVWLLWYGFDDHVAQWTGEAWLGHIPLLVWCVIGIVIGALSDDKA